MKVEGPKETNNVSSYKKELTNFPGIFNYNGNNITFKTVNNTVMVNATEMAKGFDKRFPDWIRLKSTKEFLYVLSTIKIRIIVVVQICTTVFNMLVIKNLNSLCQAQKKIIALF